MGDGLRLSVSHPTSLIYTLRTWVDCVRFNIINNYYHLYFHLLSSPGWPAGGYTAPGIAALRAQPGRERVTVPAQRGHHAGGNRPHTHTFPGEIMHNLQFRPRLLAIAVALASL